MHMQVEFLARTAHILCSYSSKLYPRAIQLVAHGKRDPVFEGSKSCMCICRGKERLFFTYQGLPLRKGSIGMISLRKAVCISNATNQSKFTREKTSERVPGERNLKAWAWKNETDGRWRDETPRPTSEIYQ